MSDTNELYGKALKAIDILLGRKDFATAKDTLDDLYQFKPVRLTWFVRKARFLWLTDGIKSAKEVLKNKFTLNYCYEGIPEALQLLADMELQRGNVLEYSRFMCALDLIQNFGRADTVYDNNLEEVEKHGKHFWETGSVQSARILWEKAYIISDAIAAMVIQQYLKAFTEYNVDLPWTTDLPNIQYVQERLDEETGDFIVLAEDDNQWRSAALARMLSELGKNVYLLQPPSLFTGNAQEFFGKSGASCVSQMQHQGKVSVIDTYYIQVDKQLFDNRYLILEQLIGDGGKLFTVFGSGSLMDDVGLEGEMKKHFERFNLMIGDIFDTNFSAGWAGDYLKYIENIYEFDPNVCLTAPARCKYSIVVPARNSARTLRYTLQTCLEQNFPKDEYEIVVSDNSTDNNQAVYQLCEELSDPRIRYIKPPHELSLGRSFEFAFLHTHGEFILSLGSDDGLLPWALSTLERVRAQFPDKNIIQWERGFYAWPGFNGGQENQLLIPRNYRDISQFMYYLSATNYLDAINQNPQNIYALPLLYINSGFRREYMKVLLEKTGRMWDGGAQDIYIGFVNIFINSQILNICYPLSIAGMSPNSVGAVAAGNRGDSQNKKAVAAISKGVTLSIWTPSMPEKLATPGSSDAALAMHFIYRCVTRGLIDFDNVSQAFDIKTFFMAAANSCNRSNEQSESELRQLLYVASMYGEDFYHWCDETIFVPAMIPQIYGDYVVPKYQEGTNADGGETLDASKYGVRNIAEAVHLFAQRSGLS